MKLKKGDEVQVVKGKDKGKTGKVEKVFEKDGKVFVSGVNLYKRHMKARSQKESSEIITIGKPLPVANVVFICPKCHLMVRIGYKVEMGVKNKESTKSRICKKCESII